MVNFAPVNINVKILGIGGAGGNTLSFLNKANIDRLKFTYIDSDANSLEASSLVDKQLIGKSVTRGLSTGGNPDIGRKIAQEDIEQLRKIIEGVDLLIIVTGLGGGFSSGVTPVLVKEAKRQGSLVFCFACLPFTLEGKQKYTAANNALSELQGDSAAVVLLPNDLLLQALEPTATVLEAFQAASQWVGRGIKALVSIVRQTGMINVDFATLTTIFSEQGGKTLYGLGHGEGEGALQKALDDLALCPMLFAPQQSRQADRLLVNITGGKNLTLGDINLALATLAEKFCSKESTVVGAVIDPSKKDYVDICVIGKAEARAIKKGAHKTATTKGGKKIIPSELPVYQNHMEQQELNLEEVMDYSELSFLIDHNKPENRGLFDETEQNLFNGEDLDVPTYLRRGIKIRL